MLAPLVLHFSQLDERSPRRQLFRTCPQFTLVTTIHQTNGTNN